MKQECYKAALYLRLSRDDDLKGDSESIQNQRKILQSYCNEQKIPVYDTYIDDGYSGLNFDRPHFIRMIEDIKKGFINLVITKDLSRLGRDYIQTGFYTEIFFPEHFVRYIALNDNVDTKNDDNDIAPFKNILNDMYAKDLSRKIKSAKQIKAINGAFIGCHAPYGYKTCDDNCNILEINPETAPIVENVFYMALKDMGSVTIAKELTNQKVLTPSAYKVSKGDTRFSYLFAGKPEHENYRWSYNTVRKILQDKVYLGHMINHKSCVQNYKTKRRIIIPENDQIIVKNVHPPLISEDDFEKVQYLMKSRHTVPQKDKENVFRGLLFCEECGHRLSMATKKYNGKETHYYRCLHHYHFPENCKHTHYLLYSDLYSIIFSDFKRITGMLYNHTENLIQILNNTSQEKNSIVQIDKNLSFILQRQKEIKNIIKHLYEDNLNDNISSENFSHLMKEYQNEQQINYEKIIKLNEKKAELTDNSEKLYHLEQTVIKYLNTEKLSSYIVNELIEKIVVSHAQKSKDVKHQKIKIFYRFADETGYNLN